MIALKKYWKPIGLVTLVLLAILTMLAMRPEPEYNPNKRCNATDAQDTIQVLLDARNPSATGDALESVLGEARCAGRVYVALINADKHLLQSVLKRYVEVSLSKNRVPFIDRVKTGEDTIHQLTHGAMHRFALLLNPSIRTNPAWDDMLISQHEAAERATPGLNYTLLSTKPSKSIPFTNVPVNPPPVINLNGNNIITTNPAVAATHTPTSTNAVTTDLLFGRSGALKSLLLSAQDWSDVELSGVVNRDSSGWKLFAPAVHVASQQS